jgi:hypothetical protein
MNNADKVLNAKIDEEIILNHDYIEKVRFKDFTNSCDNYVREHPYSWVAYTTSTYSHRTIFPMRNSTYVSFFKTLIGAKRNFIKNYLKEEK